MLWSWPSVRLGMSLTATVTVSLSSSAKGGLRFSSFQLLSLCLYSGVLITLMNLSHLHGGVAGSYICGEALGERISAGL